MWRAAALPHPLCRPSGHRALRRSDAVSCLVPMHPPSLHSGSGYAWVRSSTHWWLGCGLNVMH
ncbi:hypothetical protein OF83DRAFT_436492 [Amylostereum chailletii]|nr:hypothetical protein OF83DRAFT_436492 [Amylostereum chailletii]